MTTPVPHADVKGSPALPTQRFSRDDYLRMVEGGILGPDDHVELIEGAIVEMSPSGPRHAEFVDRFVRLFADVTDQAQLRVQGTIALTESTVVDPDIVLLRRKDGGYAEALPAADDVLLLIEVSDESLERDLKVKAGVYAEAGITDYWVVDVANGAIIVHRDPAGGRYGSVVTARGDEHVEPVGLPYKPVGVGALFF